MRSGGRSLTVWALCVAFSAPVACSSSEDSPMDTGGAAPGDAGAASDSGEDALDGGADPARNDDPQDLDPEGGDPSLDIAGSWIYFDADRPWVRVEFFGKWPVAETLYSWSCSVLLGTENAPLVTFTVQSLTGTQTEHADGIDEAKVTFAAEPKGFRVMFADATLQFDRYALECQVKKTNKGTLTQDASGSFEVKTREPRTFGP